MPGQEQWEQGQWEIVGQLFERVARLLGEADCTLIADRGLSCLKLIELCQAHGWHYVLRIKQEEYAQRKRYGHFCALSRFLSFDVTRSIKWRCKKAYPDAGKHNLAHCHAQLFSDKGH